MMNAPVILKGFNGEVVHTDKTLLDIDRMECEESLYTFLAGAWKWIDPSPFTDGWPIEAIAEHLQAVVDGDLKRLIINIPPRMGKSSITSVAFPAWAWAQTHTSPTSGPGVQFLHASYAQQLSLRDSVKCRRLITSPWYQERWGDRFKMTGDQNAKTRFDNNKGGSRLSTSVGSALTGEGGSIIVVDDPNAAQEAFSEATIESTIEWWDSALSTRLNDPKTGAFVVIQQRLSEEDLTGHILSKDVGDWCHLMLPMRYEADRAFVNTMGWSDPRTEEGELLWPERMGEKEVSLLERQLGPWGAAGQLQQRPEPKGGGIIKRDWWTLWNQDNFPPVEYIIASLDTAFTTKTENDYSAMTVWGIFSGGDQKAVATRVTGRDGLLNFVEERKYTEEHPRVIMMHAWQERLELHDLVNKVAETMKTYKVDKLLVENKASGPSVIQELRRIFNHLPFVVEPIDLIKTHSHLSIDKISRAHAVVPLFAGGLVYAPDRSWADMVITQCSTFPKAKHDDLVDTVTMALQYMRRTGLIIRGEEWTADVEGGMLHTGAPPEALYPA
ncbi:MAG: hypothetical protein EB015_07365 [Methylocystaceae bacterium]|nr:hypothetical protein [Methylocystaceae bacterium]